MQIEKFTLYADFGGDPAECVEWLGSKKANGYGELRVAGKTGYAHRRSYELFKGQIPSGTEIDHLCRNKGCVNPDHLEAVTRSENIKRMIPYRPPYQLDREACPQGHAYDATTKQGYRYCKRCARDRQAKYIARKWDGES